jgi:uncharacterized protein YndB with AHSA1/START domain
MDDEIVEVTVRVPAAPAEVFGYFTDPAQQVRWMGRSARLDPRPGGDYYVEMGDGFAAAGSFLELDPPGRVSFTWGWAPGAGKAVLAGPQDDSLLPPGASRVTVTLVASDDGCRLRLLHQGLPGPALRDAHRVAWRTYLDRLVIVAAGGDPGQDPHG